jgi:Sensors of blue-light using FAD
MTMMRLIYFSETNFPIAGAQGRDMFRKILEASARHNIERGLTGALIFDWDFFLQVLEGEREKVSQTFVAIAQDRRHKHVTLVDAAPIDRRQFSSWTMIHKDDKPETKAIIQRYGPDALFLPARITAIGLLDLCKDLVVMKGGVVSDQAAA